jgi:hypothetical protein
MNEMSIKPEDLELVANLIGSTSGQLKAIDSNAVDGRNSPTFKASKLDARAAIKDAITRIDPNSGRSSREEIGPYPPPGFPHHEEFIRATPPSISQQTSVAATQMVIIDTATAQKIIEDLKNLQLLCTTLSQQVLHLTSVDDKISRVIEKSLKQGVKSLTIKLNEQVE